MRRIDARQNAALIGRLIAEYMGFFAKNSLFSSGYQAVEVRI
jgi:hypothetical protein